jgi:hypothetical protein
VSINSVIILALAMGICLGQSQAQDFSKLRSCPNSRANNQDFIPVRQQSSTQSNQLCTFISPAHCPQDRVSTSCQQINIPGLWGLGQALQSIRPVCTFQQKDIQSTSTNDFITLLTQYGQSPWAIEALLRKYKEMQQQQNWCDIQQSLVGNQALIQQLRAMILDNNIDLNTRIEMFAYLKHFDGLNEQIQQELIKSLQAKLSDIKNNQSVEELKELIKMSHYILSPGLDFFIKLSRRTFGESKLNTRVLSALRVFSTMKFDGSVDRVLQNIYRNIGYFEAMNPGSHLDYIVENGVNNKDFLNCVDSYFEKIKGNDKERAGISLLTILYIHDLPAPYADHIFNKAYQQHEQMRQNPDIKSYRLRPVRDMLVSEFVRREMDLEHNQEMIIGIIDLRLLNKNTDWSEEINLLNKLKKSKENLTPILNTHAAGFLASSLSFGKRKERSEVVEYASSYQFNKQQIDYLLKFVPGLNGYDVKESELDAWKKLIDNSTISAEEKTRIKNLFVASARP